MPLSPCDEIPVTERAHHSAAAVMPDAPGVLGDVEIGRSARHR
ncbi:hypothetical protein [Amycolatopsis saalfeldensis]|nr:hypothetical protein [Amycolatopsis saalfeldensis]